MEPVAGCSKRLISEEGIPEERKRCKLEAEVEAEGEATTVKDEDYSQTQHGILDFSDDVLLMILKHCPPRDLKALGFVCPRLGRLVCDRSLWCRVDARSHGVGREQLAWFLDHTIGRHTVSVALSGFAREAKGCLGTVDAKRPFIEKKKPQPSGKSAAAAAPRPGGSNSGGVKESSAQTAEPAAVSPWLCPARQPCFHFQSSNNPQLPRFSASPAWRPTETANGTKDERDGDGEARTEASGCGGPRWTLARTTLAELSSLCPRLTELRLEYANINCSVTPICNFPKTLKVLSLRGSRCYNLEVNKTYLNRIHDYLPLLEEVDVGECNWMEPASLLPVSKLEHLRVLRAERCRRLAECVAYASLAARYGFKKLKILDVRGTPLGDSEVSGLGWLPELEELYLEPAEMRESVENHSHYMDDPCVTIAEREPWEYEEPEYFSGEEPPPPAMCDSCNLPKSVYSTEAVEELRARQPGDARELAIRQYRHFLRENRHRHDAREDYEAREMQERAAHIREIAAAERSLMTEQRRVLCNLPRQELGHLLWQGLQRMPPEELENLGRRDPQNVLRQGLQRMPPEELENLARHVPQNMLPPDLQLPPRLDLQLDLQQQEPLNLVGLEPQNLQEEEPQNLPEEERPQHHQLRANMVAREFAEEPPLPHVGEPVRRNVLPDYELENHVQQIRRNLLGQERRPDQPHLPRQNAAPRVLQGQGRQELQNLAQQEPQNLARHEPQNLAQRESQKLALQAPQNLARQKLHDLAGQEPQQIVGLEPQNLVRQEPQNLLDQEPENLSREPRPGPSTRQCSFINDAGLPKAGPSKKQRTSSNDAGQPRSKRAKRSASADDEATPDASTARLARLNRSQYLPPHMANTAGPSVSTRSKRRALSADGRHSTSPADDGPSTSMRSRRRRQTLPPPWPTASKRPKRLCNSRGVALPTSNRGNRALAKGPGPPRANASNMRWSSARERLPVNGAPNEGDARGGRPSPRGSAHNQDVRIEGRVTRRNSAPAAGAEAVDAYYDNWQENIERINARSRLRLRLGRGNAAAAAPLGSEAAAAGDRVRQMEHRRAQLEGMRRRILQEEGEEDDMDVLEELDDMYGEGRVHVIYVNVRRPRHELFRMLVQEEEPRVAEDNRQRPRRDADPAVVNVRAVPRAAAVEDVDAPRENEALRNGPGFAIIPGHVFNHAAHANQGNVLNILRMPFIQNFLYGPVTAHMSGASLITDAAINRFGHSESPDVVNYVHIGPNGALHAGAPHGHNSDRPDKSKLKILVCRGFNGITNRTLNHLVTAAPDLRLLDVTGTKITEADVRAFKNLRPDCDVKCTIKKEK